jgi:SAM-dependent methyltransferase
MHKTAENNVTFFFENYIYPNKSDIKILEIGSCIGGFDIRSLKPANATYIGVDLDAYQGVDIVLKDPYKLPFEDNTFDYVISSSCFEHTEFFWLSYLEIIRVLKSDGVFYLNAPSNGDFHRYPVDCWRFYPDSANALVNFGKISGYQSAVLEQYTSDKENDIWSDYVAIFLKDIIHVEKHKERIIDKFTNFTNGSKYPHQNLINELKWQ